MQLLPKRCAISPYKIPGGGIIIVDMFKYILLRWYKYIDKCMYVQVYDQLTIQARNDHVGMKINCEMLFHHFLSSLSTKFVRLSQQIHKRS